MFQEKLYTREEKKEDDLTKKNLVWKKYINNFLNLKNTITYY